MNFADDEQIMKTTFKDLMTQHQMKHIDYFTFNSIQNNSNKEIENRYYLLTTKVAELVSFNC